jgi:hypothetical protein
MGLRISISMLDRIESLSSNEESAETQAFEVGYAVVSNQFSTKKKLSDDLSRYTIFVRLVESGLVPELYRRLSVYGFFLFLTTIEFTIMK